MNDDLMRAFENVHVEPRLLALRWVLTADSLGNMRRSGSGPPWHRVGTHPRYKASDLVRSEIAGAAGIVTLKRALLAAATCTGVSTSTRIRIQDRLRKAFANG